MLPNASTSREILAAMSEADLRELLTIRDAIEEVRQGSGYGAVEAVVKCGLITEISVTYSMVAANLNVRRKKTKDAK